MVLDSSALVAIILDEPESRQLTSKIDDAESVMIGAPTLFETAMVLQREGGDSVVRMTGYLRSIGVKIIPFGEPHYEVSLRAFIRFGKGRHPARLNILDCMSYAIAAVAGLPLLYVGDDFSKTDIEAA